MITTMTSSSLKTRPLSRRQLGSITWRTWQYEILQCDTPDITGCSLVVQPTKTQDQRTILQASREDLVLIIFHTSKNAALTKSHGTKDGRSAVSIPREDMHLLLLGHAFMTFIQRTVQKDPHWTLFMQPDSISMTVFPNSHSLYRAHSKRALESCERHAKPSEAAKCNHILKLSAALVNKKGQS